MGTDVILPALGMAQDTGRILQWLKSAGAHVTKGEPLAEIETDKVTVEIEAPADGILAHILAVAGADVPVGQVIAQIVSTNEVPHSANARQQGTQVGVHNGSVQAGSAAPQPVSEAPPPSVCIATILAARVAAEHHIDLHQVKATGRRIEKADVLAYLRDQEARILTPRRVLASPKARRLANEQGKDLSTIKGSGPAGAVLAADVLAGVPLETYAESEATMVRQEGAAKLVSTDGTLSLVRSENTNKRDQANSHIWEIMAQRTTQSWTSAPHFYLTREVNATRLVQWQESLASEDTSDRPRITYTDLLVKIVAASLRLHPRLNASWNEKGITQHSEVHVGLAVAVEDGLVVPVIHYADRADLNKLAHQRTELVAKARAGRLRLEDISGGTFTISNLGMFNVDAFNAIINQPQVAILAVGRIAERVVAVHGQPAVQSTILLTLSCDHRAIDGARGAKFLDTIVRLIEEPLGLLR